MDELKSIAVETARIRLERERFALQDDLDRRRRNTRVAGVSQTIIDTTLAVGGSATKVAFNTTKFGVKALMGATVAVVVSLMWVAFQKWDGTLLHMTYEYFYWLGRGGFVFILVCTIGYRQNQR